MEIEWHDLVLGSRAYEVLFQGSRSLFYYHTPKVTPKELEAAISRRASIEIDIAWAYEAFVDGVEKDQPYIGHPQEFYTVLGKEFPKENVTISYAVNQLKLHPEVLVVLDCKDTNAISAVASIVGELGAARCLIHAFIKDWTPDCAKYGVTPEPHWYREDIDLGTIGVFCDTAKVPLIANCRGFSDDVVKQEDLVTRMVADAKHYPSIISLGLYYPGAPIPAIEYLQTIHSSGFAPWANGNRYTQPIVDIPVVAMEDDIGLCSVF